MEAMTQTNSTLSLLQFKRPAFLFLLSFMFTHMLSSISWAQQNPIEENPLRIQGSITNGKIEIHGRLSKDFKAYVDQFELRIHFPEDDVINIDTLQPKFEFYDSFTKKQREGVADEFTISAKIVNFAEFSEKNDRADLSLKFQACTETYCLFPQTLKLTIPLAKPAEEGFSFSNLQFEKEMNRGLLWAFLIAFLAGVLTSFTPCIFPIIPITLAVLGRDAHLRSKRQQWLVSHVYVLGISVVYSALGVAAAASGKLFGSFMTHPLVLGATCLIYFGMSLSLFGLFELHAPLKMQNALMQLRVSGWKGIFLQGLVAGLIASPCVGPVLVGILTFVSRTQNLWLGFWLLFVFALGMGQLFLFFGVSSQASKFLPQSGPWMERIKWLFGALLLLPFFYFLKLSLPPQFQLLVGFGTSLLFFLSLRKVSHFLRWAIPVSILLWSFTQFFFNQKSQSNPSRGSQQIESKTRFQPYSDERFEQAVRDGKPIVLDFWAEWCAACIQLENETFSSAEFQNATRDAVLLKFDATTSSPQLENFRKKFRILGLPTVVLIDASGKWREDLTVHEYLPTSEFLKRFRQLDHTK